MSNGQIPAAQVADLAATIAAAISDALAGLTAADVDFAPAGDLSSTDVQAAIVEVYDAIATQVAALVDAAPGTLDTLNELAAALGDDPNFATTIAGQIAAKLSVSLVDAKGDLLVATANDVIARLAVGSNGQVLTADSTTTPGVKWATPATPTTVANDAIFDAKGDLPVATGSDAAGRLPVGSNGQVLTADSTQTTGVKWATPTGGSGSATTALVPMVSQIGTGDPGLVWTDAGELLLVEVPL